MNNSVLLLVLIPVLFSCNNSTNNKTGNKTITTDSTLVAKKIRDIEPGLWKTDSLQILYYDNPDGDSLRYTRYFTFTETTDSAKVTALLNEFDKVFVQYNKPKNCRSEGKLFLLSEEDVLKTVYFSTRGDTCSYLYFIKDGAFIYFPISENARKFLKENKALAHKP